MSTRLEYKECDLVMKGGITSGIVYPPLVLKLKEDKYHFRNIGGTSAGAIAAAATAAAEYGRDAKGFEKLDALKAQLSTGTFLRDLFQPSQETAPLMNVLLDCITILKRQSGSPLQLLPRLTGSLLRHVPFIFVAGAFLGITLTYLLVALVGGSVFGWRMIFPIFMAWLGALLASGIYLAFILTQKVPENLLGICTGRKNDPKEQDPPVLTDWLSDRLNDLAGINTGAKPLTFGDLRCKKFGDDRDGLQPKEDNITLRMVTSNLSQNQPYVLPFKEQLFIFNCDDFAKLFPEPVLAYLLGLNTQKLANIELPEGYFFLPKADDLPVIVATRMSLSFPVLLSAVRLYTIKPEKITFGEESVKLAVDDLQVNWFSDGGICSNFPIHFFDTWLPTRPTFGVNLTSMPEKQLTRVPGSQVQVKVKLDYMSPTSTFSTTQINDNAIYLPKPQDCPATEFIPLADALIENGVVPVPKLLRFLGAIFSTAQNYRDNAQSVLPSYRERVVQVRLSEDEGGLNLAMPQETIKQVISKGEQAGEVLVREFNLKIHQWVRFRVLMKQMEATITEMDKVIRNNSIYCDLVNQQFDPKGYPYYPEPCEVEWLRQVAERLVGIGNQVECWKPSGLFDKEPSPLPEPVLRVMPEI